MRIKELTWFIECRLLLVIIKNMLFYILPIHEKEFIFIYKLKYVYIYVKIIFHGVLNKILNISIEVSNKSIG